MTRAGRSALGAAAIGLVVFCGLRLEIGTDLTNFMPDARGSGSGARLAEISSRLTDSALTRTLILSIGGGELDAAVEAADALARALREDPEIAWARAGVDEERFEEIYDLYFPRRHYFLSDRPEETLPELLSDAGLRTRARELVHRLASPAGSLLSRVAPEDPLGGFERVLERLRASEPTLAAVRGRFVTSDRRFAIVLVATRASAFDSGVQAALLERVRERFGAIERELGADLELEMAGASRFAVSAEKTMKRDVYAIGALSFLCVAGLFLAFVRSLRGFLLVSLPPLAGILVATSGGLLVFGRLDGLTMVFGASLMGIAIDYSNHLLVHYGLAEPRESPARTVRRLRPSLVLGALTTVASFGGLAATAFPAFREMSFFAGVGVIASLLVSLTVVPDLLPAVPPLPAAARSAAARLDGVLRALDRMPRSVPVLVLAAAAPAALLLPALEWSDDMSRLARFDPALVEEDQRVRERVTGLDSSRFVVGVADDLAEALALNDRLHARLEALIARGALEGARSLHPILWSPALQRRNWEIVSAAPDLAARADAAFTAEGFRPGALEPFARALASPPPPPLDLSDLERSAFADLVAPFVLRLDDRVAVVLYLRGVRDPEAVREAVADLDAVYAFDQKSFVNDVYREFRRTTLEQMGIGALLVVALLALRYRAWRPVLAAFLPSVLVAVLVLAALSALGVQANLLHVMSLIMVMGMGVDYGVFLVDSAARGSTTGATMLGLLLSCLTTACVFGALSFSSQPALRAIGVTTGLGILLSYGLAPVSLAATGMTGRRGRAP